MLDSGRRVEARLVGWPSESHHESAARWATGGAYNGGAYNEGAYNGGAYNEGRASLPEYSREYSREARIDAFLDDDGYYLITT